MIKNPSQTSAAEPAEQSMLQIRRSRSDDHRPPPIDTGQTIETDTDQLFNAIYNNKVSDIRLLLTGGHLNINAVNKDGATPLLRAIYQNCTPEIMQLLLDHGANLEQVGILEQQKWTPAGRISYQGREDLGKLLIKYLETEKLKIEVSQAPSQADQERLKKIDESISILQKQSNEQSGTLSKQQEQLSQCEKRLTEYEAQSLKQDSKIQELSSKVDVLSATIEKLSASLSLMSSKYSEGADHEPHSAPISSLQGSSFADGHDPVSLAGHHH